MDMQRRDKVNYYLDLAEAVSQRGTCLRKLYGAVIVKNDEVISTGYVGAPGTTELLGPGVLPAQQAGHPRGERYELCPLSVHAEANAIICASRRDMIKRHPVPGGKRGLHRGSIWTPCAAPCASTHGDQRGIEWVIVRDDKDRYRVIGLNQWVADDESLKGGAGLLRVRKGIAPTTACWTRCGGCASAWWPTTACVRPGGHLFGLPSAWYTGLPGYIWQQSICWTFILLSGMCWQLSRHHVKRGLLLVGCGAAISLITWLAMPSQRILYGVLNLLGLSALLLIP